MGRSRSRTIARKFNRKWWILFLVLIIGGVLMVFVALVPLASKKVELVNSCFPSSPAIVRYHVLLGEKFMYDHAERYAPERLRPVDGVSQFVCAGSSLGVPSVEVELYL